MSMQIWVSITISLTAALVIFGACGASVALDMRNVRRRTRTIRERDIPPFAMWQKQRYPKATLQEAETIEAVLKAIATIAGTEPTQLQPDDVLEGFVFGRRRMGRSLFFDDDDDWSYLLEDLAVSIDWHRPELTAWEMEAYASWETAGDVIDFMLKRLDHARRVSPSRMQA